MRLDVKISDALRGVYHRTVPARVREPFGLLRRRAADRWARCLASGPLPPRSALTRVQMSGDVREYLAVGRRCARTVATLLSEAGVHPASSARVLDFGCGLGRTLRWLARETCWSLEGCDVDRESVDWTAAALPQVEVRATGSEPPLPWSDGRFDAIYAISVFTHFDVRQQRLWAGELFRILRPGGFLVASTMGPTALEAFPDLATTHHRARLRDDGFLFLGPDGGTFNARGAFHRESGVERLLGGPLELLRWAPEGLDGFQDVSLLRRPPGPDPARTDVLSG